MLPAQLTATQTIPLTTGLKLGSATNLINGYRPTWDAGAASDSPLYAPKQAPLTKIEPQVQADTNVRFEFPQLSLHRDAVSLVNSLYKYKVLPTTTSDPQFNIPSGPLTINDKDAEAATQALSKWLGVSLSKNDNLSYVLVEIKREVGSVVHPLVRTDVFNNSSITSFLTPEFASRIKKLRPGRKKFEGTKLRTKLTGQEANNYLGVSQQYGTHFVSRITAGDIIFQVFAYKLAAFEQIERTYNSNPGSMSGPFAVDFNYFTKPYNPSTNFGYVAEGGYGNVLCTSRDPALVNSVQSGEWYDNEWANTNSIFAPYGKGTTLQLFARFTRIVPIAFELKPLDYFAEYYRGINWQRIVKGALYQKFGDHIIPGFVNESICSLLSEPQQNNCSLTNIYPQTQEGFVSTIATPTINVYKQRLNISEVKFIAPELVKDFTLLTNALQIPKLQDELYNLPGDQVSLFAHIVEIDHSGGKIPKLVLSTQGFKNFTLVCEEFLGALEIISQDNQTQRDVIVDGFYYTLGANTVVPERHGVTINRDVFTPPSEKSLTAQLANFEFSLAAAEAIISGRSTSFAQRLTSKYLNWLGTIFPVTSRNQEIREFRMRALYLSRAANQLKSEGVHVPYLTYATYTPLVESILGVADQIKNQVTAYQQQISLRKLAELMIDVGKTLNENIKQTGNQLTDYISAMSKYQADMANYYDSVIQQKQKDFQQEVNNVDILNSKLKSQQVVVDIAVENLETALGNYATQEIFRFAFSVAMDVFKLGVSLVALPVAAPAEATKLAATAQKIKEILDVLDALSTLFKDINVIITKIESVENALEATGNQGTDLLTALEWREYYENMELTLENATRGITNNSGVANAKATLLSAFRILVMRGEELLNVKSRTVQILTEIYFTKKRQEVNNNQAARLQNLSRAMNPGNIQDLDKSSIDLVGLTGQLEFQEKQVLLLLAKTLVVQDQALQYQYLGTPTPIGSFDLLSLRMVIVQQKQSILNALSNLNPPPQKVPQPFIYEIQGIPSDTLLNDNAYQFRINLAASEFWQYAMVRIDKVIVETDDVQSTNSGQYLIELVYQGTPLEDRNQNRNVLLFNTVQRGFGPYLYEVDSNRALFGTDVGSIADSITNITPFSHWRVSFSNTQTNQGIKLKRDFISLRLKFYVTALLRDPRSFLSAGSIPADYQTGSVNDVLAEMYERGSVMNGWDVVFNYTQESINDLLQKQYENRKNLPDFFWKIPEQIFSVGYPFSCGFTEWQITFKAPKIKFLSGNYNAVYIRLDVESGYIKKGSFPQPEEEPKCSEVDPNVIKWATERPISTDGFLEAHVPLGKLKGDVLTQNKVVVNLAKGAFLTQDLKVDVDDATLNAQLTKYMQSNNFVYTLGTIDDKDITTLPSLRPTQFLFNILTTNLGKNILQLYITTTGQQQLNLSLSLGEPIPQGYGCSLMINTKILWQDIFVKSFNSSGNIRVAAKAPVENYKSYSAYVISGQVISVIDFKDRSHDLRINENGNQIIWELAGMTFQPSESSGIALHYNKTKNQGFQAYRCTAYPCGLGSCQSCSWQNYSLDVTVDLSGTYRIQIVGSGLNQQVKIDSKPPEVKVDGKLDDAGACKCNDRDLQQSFIDLLRKDVPEQLAKQIGGLPFESISLFALKSLLFPEQNIVNLEKAYIPGDLVIFGNFVQT